MFLDGDGYDVFEIRELEPVPITVEMLLKSGFKYDGTCVYRLEKDEPYLWIKVIPIDPQNEWWESGMTGFEVFNKQSDISIDCMPNIYVHQLQNALLFAGMDDINSILKL